MRNNLYSCVKYVVNRLFFHGKKFVKDVDEVFKKRVNTAEEAKDLLRQRASVNDLYEITKSIDGRRFADNLPGSYIPSSEYTLYNDGGFNIYYFNGEKSDFLSDEEVLKVSKIINALENKPSKVFGFKAVYKSQFYFLIHEGKNGGGDFVDDDMKNVVKYLDAMSKAGATWRTITDLHNDIVDDVSDWVITFTID